jgi:serine/threonine protein phosphatase 1
MSVPIYAIGDIHGQMQELDRVLELIKKDGILFVHAGIRPMVPISNQSEEDLIWIRHEFHEYRSPHPKLIVHGHTPVNKAAHYGNRVNLDTGAGYGKPLTAAVFEAGQAWVLTENGRRTLAP